MKKAIALALALMMLLALCACGDSDAKQDETPTVKIGVFEPLSGANGPGGKQEYLGMQYANYVTPTVEINGTVYNVELVPSRHDFSPYQGRPRGV